MTERRESRPPKPSYLVADLTKDTNEIAESKGYEASEQAHARTDNPYPLRESQLFQWWDSGWCQALDDLCG